MNYVKATVVIVLVVGAFIAGRKSCTPSIVEKVVEKKVEVVNTVEKVVTHTEKLPNGTIITDTIETKNTTEKLVENKTDIKLDDGRKWQVGASKSITNSDYELLLGYSIIKNVSIYGTINTDKQAHIGLSVSF